MKYKIDWPSRGHLYNNAELNDLNSFLNEKNTSLSKSKYVLKFEKLFSDYVGVKSLTTMSGAHSLDISSFLLEANDNAEIIIPSHTYCASAIPFVRSKSKIIWADINKDCFTISYDHVKKLITPKTKAIFIVHLYGLIATDTEKIIALAKKNKIKVIEDCAQALGAFKGNKSVGSFGDISCFSFHSQKNLTTLGEGGMICTNNNDFIEKIKLYRHNGHKPFENSTDYWLPAMTDVCEVSNDFIPMKSTMSESQALIGLSVLKSLNNLTEKRRELFNYMTSKLSSINELQFQKFNEKTSHSHHLLPARCTSKKWNRDDLIRILHNKFSIKCVIQYYPLHRYSLFRNLGYGLANVPETEKFYDNMISFPFSIIFNKREVDYIITSISESIKLLNEHSNNSGKSGE